MQNIKQLFKLAAYKLLHMLSWRKTVLFESMPDCSDNTKAVFDEMVRRGLHRKYEFIWMLHGDAAPENPVPHVRYIPGKGQGLKYRFSYFSALARAKCVVCCNRFLTPVHPSTKAFYLAHGTPMKSVRHYYNVPKSIQYCLAASSNVEKMTAYEFRVDEDKMFSLGYPRNDVFSQTPVDVKNILQTKCDKVVIWYPTFRQAKNGRMAGGSHALPIIHNVEDAHELNDFAARHNVLIVLKPHFAQDTRMITDLNLANIRFIDDHFFVQHNVTSYEFVGGCDALITDYSSIYYDYTLCNKPIALVWEDLEEYRKEPGFAVDLDFFAKGAVKVYTSEQMKQFLYDVSVGCDTCKTEREEIRDLVNYSTDGKNAERVVAFIREKAGL